MHRLGDLPRRGRVLVVVVLLALAAPFVASVVRATDVGWTPSNDEALITLRTLDVLVGEFPLIGQPSTADQYAATDPPHHPGPIEFYLLAPPVALLGSDVGVLVGAGAFNFGAVMIAAWVLFRRAGPAVALGGAVVLAGVAWAQGLAVLTDPISSNMGGIPMLALAVLAWAVIDGDLRLLPLTAFVFAFVCQQHLAVVGVAGGLAAWTGGGVLIGVGAWRGHRRRAPEAAETGRPPASAIEAPTPPVPWVAGAVVVSLVAWLPVLVDQFWGTGNLGRIVSFAGSSERSTLGIAAGIRQAVRSVGAPPLLLRTNLSGDDIHAPLSALGWFGGLAAIVALAAVVVFDRRRCRSRAALALTALVVAGLGGLNGSNVPNSIEANRLNFYRWAFVASALTWVTLGWAAMALIRRRRPGLVTRVPAPSAALAAALAVVVVAAATVVASGPSVRRDEQVFRAEHRLSTAMLGAVRGRHRILLVPDGGAASLAVGPALALDLVEAGHRIGLPPSQEQGYGDHRVDAGPYDAGIVVVSGRGAVAPGPGRVVDRIDLNAATASARTVLARQLRGQTLVTSPQAPSIVASLVGSATSDRAVVFALLLGSAADRPDELLRYPLAARALQAGYFTAPRLDASALEALVRTPVTESWNDDVIEVRVLTSAEVRAHSAELLAVGATSTG